MIRSRHAAVRAVTVLAMGVSAACGGASSDAPLANPTTSASTTTTSASVTTTTGSTIAAGSGDVVEGGCRADQVDVNIATAAELERIVHIDQARARWIIEGRPWGSIDHLRHLGGMDPARVAEIVEQDVACISD